MKAHDLAKALLEMPNYDVLLISRGNYYDSENDVGSVGPLEVVIGVPPNTTIEIPKIVLGHMLNYEQKQGLKLLKDPLPEEELQKRLNEREARTKEFQNHNKAAMSSIVEQIKDAMKDMNFDDVPWKTFQFLDTSNKC